MCPDDSLAKLEQISAHLGEHFTDYLVVVRPPGQQDLLLAASDATWARGCAHRMLTDLIYNPTKPKKEPL